MDIKHMYEMEMYAYVLDTYGSHHSLATLGITDSDTHSIVTETQLHDLYREWCTRQRYKWHATKAYVSDFFTTLYATTMITFFGKDDTMFTRTREHPPRIRFNHKYMIVLRGCIYSSRIKMDTGVKLMQNLSMQGKTVEDIVKNKEIKEHPVLRLLCTRARLTKQKKERQNYLSNYSISSIPTENLQITDFMNFTEKLKRIDIWKKVFASNNPPNVIEIHREFTNVTQTIQLVDVTLAVDDRYIRVEQLPANILPSTKRACT